MATLPLIIQIRDWTYRRDIQVPSAQAPQIPTAPSIPSTPQIPTTPPVQPTQEVRIVKMLPEDERKLPDANSGETVRITATVICKSGSMVSKPRDTAYLIIDGAIADRKIIENGIVSFEWEATAVPINIHTVCVKVEPSSSCKSPGQDCKRITVSPSSLGIAEQLARERESSAEQRRLLESARSRLRSEIIGAELQIPGTPSYEPIVPYTPSIPQPTIPTTPTVPETPTVTAPEYGDIQIIGLPAPLYPISPDLPLYVYVDDKSVGRIYELPKTVSNVTVGTHTVYVRGGDITLNPKTVYVRKNETTTVSL